MVETNEYRLCLSHACNVTQYILLREKAQRGTDHSISSKIGKMYFQALQVTSEYGQFNSTISISNPSSNPKHIPDTYTKI